MIIANGKLKKIKTVRIDSPVLKAKSLVGMTITELENAPRIYEGSQLQKDMEDYQRSKIIQALRLLNDCIDQIDIDEDEILDELEVYRGGGSRV